MAKYEELYNRAKVKVTRPNDPHLNKEGTVTYFSRWAVDVVFPDGNAGTYDFGQLVLVTDDAKLRSRVDELEKELKEIKAKLEKPKLKTKEIRLDKLTIEDAVLTDGQLLDVVGISKSVTAITVQLLGRSGQGYTYLRWLNANSPLTVEDK